MANKKKKRIIFICLAVLFFIMCIYIIISNNSNGETQKIVETIEKEAEVKKETICTTLTALGEVKSANEEKLLLNTNYYYLTMCAEEDELIKEGENVLQYTMENF